MSEKIKEWRITTEEEVRPITNLGWLIVQIKTENILSFIQEIPKDKRPLVYASGDTFGIYSSFYQGYIVGGHDIYRTGETESPFKKDHYDWVKYPGSSKIYIYGRYTDAEHYSNCLPDRFLNVNKIL